MQGVQLYTHDHAMSYMFIVLLLLLPYQMLWLETRLHEKRWGEPKAPKDDVCMREMKHAFGLRLFRVSCLHQLILLIGKTRYLNICTVTKHELHCQSYGYRRGSLLLKLGRTIVRGLTCFQSSTYSFEPPNRGHSYRGTTHAYETSNHVLSQVLITNIVSHIQLS